jgi:hypothetical protein
MSNSQRWNNNASGVHTQPTTPHSTSASPFFDNDKMLVTYVKKKGQEKKKRYFLQKKN